MALHTTFITLTSNTCPLVGREADALHLGLKEVLFDQNL